MSWPVYNLFQIHPYHFQVWDISQGSSVLQGFNSVLLGLAITSALFMLLESSVCNSKYSENGAKLLHWKLSKSRSISIGKLLVSALPWRECRSIHYNCYDVRSVLGTLALLHPNNSHRKNKHCILLGPATGCLVSVKIKETIQRCEESIPWWSAETLSTTTCT